MGRLRRLANHPIGTLQRAFRAIADKRRYSSAGGYDAERYWTDRHLRYGFDLRGVGNEGLSAEDNRQMYEQASSVFLSLCRRLGVDFEKDRILDIGCGNGFYTQICRKNGTAHYMGIDIADVHFDELRRRYPAYVFRKMDVTSHRIENRFDLILMIDVTQHITNPKKFSFAMQNIKASLSPGAVFIVTSWLQKGIRKSYYETSRSLDSYIDEFPDCGFTAPVRFRDKFIFSIQKRR